MEMSNLTPSNEQINSTS
jgi:hypothetical protein